ncbi:MAG: hydantoinase/oxoprolinase family protein, partial [Antricoccus sp.]
DHERRMREVLEREHPAATISISSDVLREYREYERSITTLVDAAVKPNIRQYVENIARRLAEFTTDENGPRAVPFYVMKSNGGVLSAAEVVHQPITTVLSGPAAGALGAAVIANQAGFSSVVTCDGGGTSTDVTVVIDSEPALTTEGTVGAYPSKIPMIDVVTVGAGGGSIAWVSPEGTLKVGPQSAGAAPGPMCYDAGGDEPTITDAHLVLGRIPPHLLGGEIPLRGDLAEQGLVALGARLNLSVEELASGILEVSAWNQANALRQITVKRGLDVRDFMMVTFGGSGSLLACRLIDILGLKGVLVPPNPGNVSAYGLLTVDVKNDYVRTHVRRHDRADLSEIDAVFTELQTDADGALAREGFTPTERVFSRTADLRYFGQAFEVRVPVADGAATQKVIDQAASDFHDAHRALYSYDFRNDSSQHVEWVNLRVTGIGPIRSPQIERATAGNGAASSESRKAFFDQWFDAPIYQRSKLGAGDSFDGPAVIEEFGSTTPLHPGFTARVDDFGNLLLRRSDQTDTAGAHQ